MKNKKITSIPFGETIEGPVMKYKLDNGNHFEIEVINYGGIITAIRVPDRNGKMGDVVLGFDSLTSYTKEHPHFGEIIGRYGNRIENGRFELGGSMIQVSTNEGDNTLHGGFRGFGKHLWDAKEISSDQTVGIEFSRPSPDGEEGFPGNLEVSVRYEIDLENRVVITYAAETDAITVVNLTNHTYFNLTANPEKSILNHELMIDANKITTVDERLIPDGTFTDLVGTPLDFKTLHKIGERIEANHYLLKIGSGYDHNYVLNDSGITHLAAFAYDSVSGRKMDVFTTEPGVQLYTGNWLDGSLLGKNKIAYLKHAGFCLETQHFPDSPNHRQFPTTTLNPGEKYHSRTIYQFSVVE